MGRTKGTPNRKTEELQAIADRLKVNPFEVLCLIAKGDAAALGYEVSEGYRMDIEIRMHAAKEAARYLYPQRKAVELSAGENGFKVIVEDYTAKAKPK